MIPLSEVETSEWRALPESCLEVISNSFGENTIRFTSYRIRTRPQPGSPDHILKRPLLHEAIVAIEGQRYKAEYVVNGWSPGLDERPEVEVIPLTWEDQGGSSISTDELGCLTSAVIAAHRLVTALMSVLS